MLHQHGDLLRRRGDDAYYIILKQNGASKMHYMCIVYMKKPYHGIMAVVEDNTFPEDNYECVGNLVDIFIGLS